jgi:tetratricopeptide (TPR) repeat protein
MTQPLRIGCAALLAACGFVFAQALPARGEGGSWVGKTIITKNPGAKIGPAPESNERKTVATLTDLIYGVEEEKGDFLRVRHRDVTGWLPRKDAVLLDEAVAFFTAQIRKDSKDAHAHGCRGLARGALGELDGAIKDLGEAIRLQPANSTWYMLRASAWEHKQQPDKALADLEVVLRIDPTDAVALYNRGNLWSDRKEYDKALADLDEAIRLQPQFAAAIGNRGIIWATKKEYDKALADFDRAIRINPRDGNAFYNRGRIWMDRADYDKALADFDQATRFDPQHAPAYASRGFVWRTRQEYVRALADYDEAVRLAPRDAQAVAHRGFVRVLRKEYDKALADFDRAVEIDAGYTAAIYARGRVWQDRKEYAKALADYDRVLRIDPKDGGALTSRALLLAACPDAKYRDGKRAVETARRACELTDWKNSYCLDPLAAAYAEAGDFAQAVKYQKQALEDPEFVRARGDKARERPQALRGRQALPRGVRFVPGEGRDPP